MNKQQQIEKMAIDIVSDILLECTAQETAEHLIGKGYINGADFVEWLKHRYTYDHWKGARVTISFEQLSEALQEYLKGE